LLPIEGPQVNELWFRWLRVSDIRKPAGKGTPSVVAHPGPVSLRVRGSFVNSVGHA
jgi:hypothetical protein